MDGSLVDRVEPEYRAPAKLMRLSGVVPLRAVIGTDGAIRNLEVVSGNLILAKAAVNAVRQWRYRPTLLDGLPVEVRTEITRRETARNGPVRVGDEGENGAAVAYLNVENRNTIPVDRRRLLCQPPLKAVGT
jgi:TonB family protein